MRIMWAHFALNPTFRSRILHACYDAEGTREVTPLSSNLPSPLKRYFIWLPSHPRFHPFPIDMDILVTRPTGNWSPFFACLIDLVLGPISYVNIQELLVGVWRLSTCLNLVASISCLPSLPYPTLVRSCALTLQVFTPISDFVDTRVIN